MKFNFKSVFLSVGIFAFTLALVGVLSTSKAEAAACHATTTGNWSTAGTWDGTCTGGGVPGTSDTVTIDAGVTVTVTANATIAGITIASPTTANGLTINDGVTLTDTGNLTYTANATANAQTITLSGTGSLAVTGTGTVNAPTGAGNSLLTCSGTGTVTFGSTLALTGNSTSTGKSSFGMGACTLSAAGITLTGGSNATGVAEITASTGTITTTAGLTFAGGGNVANAKLTTSGAATINDTGTISGGGTLSLTTSTILKFTGTSAVNTAYTTWKNWEVVSGTTTLGATQTVTGLKVDSGATLAGSTFLLTNTCASTGVNGFYIDGTYSGSGGVTLNTAGCTIDGTGTLSNTGTLTLTNAKTVASTASITLAGEVDLSAATTVTNNGVVTTTASTGIVGANGSTSIWTNAASTSTLNFGGATTTLLSTGVLNASATGNTVNYNLAGDQTVKVPGSSYYNLTLGGGSGTKTIGSGITIDNTFTVGNGVVAALTGNSTANTLYLGNIRSKQYSWGGTSSSAVNKSSTYFSGTGKVTPAAGRVVGSVGDIDTTTNVDTSTNNPADISTINTNADTTTTSTDNSTNNTSLIVTAVPLPSNIINGCGSRTTGFSVSTGQSCVGNTGVNNSNAGVSANTAVTYDFGTKTLKQGSMGDAVKQLQMFLNAKLNLNLAVDGKLGAKTIAIVKKWQKENGLKADGVIGAKTKMMMNSVN